MSKRLIILESEKKEILSLYEQSSSLYKNDLFAEAKRESFLIVKKNPYKNNEYVNARQYYSKNLKDGDLFYILGLLPEEYNKESNIKKVTDEFGKSLTGKTIRIPSDNTVFTVDEFIPSEKVTDITKFKSNFGNVTSGNYKEYHIGTLKSNNNKYGLELDLVETPTNTNTSKIKLKLEDGVVSEEIPKLSKYFTDNFLNKLLSEVSKVELKNIPDEYFEIRKVLRRKSDF